MAEALHEAVIFAGPHGAGKDTLESMFTASIPYATRHIRYSSRDQAPGEVQGQTYNFVSQKEFNAMVDRDEFVDHNSYPEGSSGISRTDLLRDVEEFRYTSITTNFEEGLTLVKKLGGLQVSNRCLFIGPCTQETMLNRPDEYLGALERRMAQRARASDDIARRLRKAALYRQLFIDNQDSVAYISNEEGKIDFALRQVMTVLGVEEQP